MSRPERENDMGPRDIRRDGRPFAEWARSLDLTRLKWTGVIAYFGVYALLFVRIDRAVNRLRPALPVAIRPAPLEPVWVLTGLPKSVAMGLVSLAVALALVGVRVAVATVAGDSGDGDRPASDP